MGEKGIEAPVQGSGAGTIAGVPISGAPISGALGAVTGTLAGASTAPPIVRTGSASSADLASAMDTATSTRPIEPPTG